MISDHHDRLLLRVVPSRGQVAGEEGEGFSIWVSRNATVLHLKEVIAW